MLSLEGLHNPGGIHASFRTLRVFFRWLESEEVLDPEWKNPIKKVRAPKVGQDPIEPIPMEDILALIKTCKADEATGLRDKATGSILIRQGKGRKSRTVFVGKASRKAIRAYMRTRQDKSPSLFVAISGERLTYDGLRQILERRTLKADLKKHPSLHDFRRAFALTMLRNKVNIFSLQILMGHADISMLRRYLAQTEDDIQSAHLMGSPVDKNLK